MSAPTPSLRPREHGAYAMLAFPVASGLAVGGWSVAGVAFAVLAGAGFLAHEAALVVLGRRGERIRSAADAAARRRLAALGGVAMAAGVAFVASASPTTLVWALPPAVLGVSVMGLVLAAGGTKFLAGELLVAAAFAAVHAPVAVAGLVRVSPGAGAGAPAWGPGGGGWAPTLLPVLVWALSFALATLSVHAVKARAQARKEGRGRGGAWVTWAAPLAALAGLGPVAVAVALWHPGVMVAAALAPKALLVLAVAVLDVHPRHLKRVGWSLVAADTVTLGMLAAAL